MTADAMTPGLLVLDRAATERALEPQRVVAAVADALIAIARGTVSAPPRIAAQAGAGLLGAMPGYVPGLGLAAKLVSVFSTATHTAHRGVVVVFDEHDGRPLALLDAGPVTAARTAAGATLSMRALAGPGIGRIAVIGTGVQARAQVALLAALGEPAPVVVGGRSRPAAEQVAALHPNASADSIAGAVADADVVFCCTGAREPVLARAWLRPGAHISSVGGSHGPELDAATVAAAALYAEWDGAAGCPPPAGAYELQGVDPTRVRLLGSVLDTVPAGPRPALTVFKSTGHAALDVAAATVGYHCARAAGLGDHIDI